MRALPLRRLPRAVAILFLVSACAGSQAQDARAPSTARALSLGFLTRTLDDVSPGEGGPAADPARPVYLRLSVPWADVEKVGGSFDWSATEAAVGRAVADGYRVVVCLTGGNPLYLEGGKPPSPLEGASLDRFTAFARDAVRALGTRVAAFEIWDGPSAVYEPPIYAFVLKSASLAIRAEARARGIEVQVVEGALPAEALDWQKALWAEDTAPYIDVLPIRFVAGAQVPETVTARVLEILAEAAGHPPAPALWSYFDAAPGGAPLEPLAAAVASLASPVTVAMAAAPETPEDRQRAARWARGFQARLGPGFAPAPAGSLLLRTPEGGERADFRILARFLNDRDFRTLVVYDAPAAGVKAGQARLVLDVPDAADPKVVDPVRGVELRTGPGPVPGVAKPALRLLLADWPMIAEWGRVSANPALELPPEALSIQSSRGLTAEEIVARYQAVQKEQDDRLERWTATGRLNYSFKIAQGGSSFDVTIDSKYSWERGGQLEWEQVKYYVNGNAVPWKTIPDIPLIQPEKVATLPLDLTLDKTYVYKRLDDDRVGDRPAYVLGFEPASPSPGRTLYRGRVWIDQETFARLKASVIQTGLEPPVTSNEETDTFTPVRGGDGFEYRLMTDLKGQQLWVIGGRNVVVRREIQFQSFEINPEKAAFDAARAASYASKNKVLRDTDQGYRYLEREPDGTRKVQEKEKKDVLFLAFGALKDGSRPNVVPLAGVNYFKFDAGGKNNQLNVFFAGALAFVNYSAPKVGGTKMDLTGEGAFFAIKGDDKVFQNGQEIVPQRIQTRDQYVNVRLGLPLGSFFKLTFVGGLEWNQYFDAKIDATSTRPPGQIFILPQDHTVLDATLQAEFNRKGFTVTGRYTQSWRSDWAPWGLYDTTTGSYVDPEYSPSHKDFSDWQIAVFKEWYLPKFQKVRIEADYLDGQDLDRFSRWSFGMFGDDRLNGFSGTGVRFDRGAIGRLGYSFNLFNVVRLDAAVDTASVKDLLLNASFQRFTGAGLAANVVGPWKTVIQLSYGRAVKSDIPELVGNQEFLLVILKLF